MSVSGVSLLLGGAPALATPFASAGTVLANEVSASETGSGPLDGMVFVSKIGSEGNLAFGEELYFRERQKE
jgi:hypothetical protein